MSNALNLTVPQWAYPTDLWVSQISVGAVIVPKNGLYVTDQDVLDSLVGYSEDSNKHTPDLSFSATLPAPGPGYVDPTSKALAGRLANPADPFTAALNAAFVAVTDASGNPVSGQNTRIILDAFGDVDDIVSEAI